jgi:Tfp pilus assembly protein FimT
MRRYERGFSIAEVMIVSAITMVTVGIAAPTITSAVRSYGIEAAGQSVATTVRNARYRAVTKNVTLRVRFNCPAANQMRVIEVTGNGAIDDAANRCDTTAFPYPDPDPAVLPNNDGPVVTMTRCPWRDEDFSISNQPDHTACRRSANHDSVGDSYAVKNLTVSGSGQVMLSTGSYAVSSNPASTSSRRRLASRSSSVIGPSS